MSNLKKPEKYNHHKKKAFTEQPVSQKLRGYLNFKTTSGLNMNLRN